MYSAAVPNDVTSESKMDKSAANEELTSFSSMMGSELLARKKAREECMSRSYAPISFFNTKCKSRKTYIPLSFFPTIVPDDSPMDMDKSPVFFPSYKEALMSSQSNTCKGNTFLICDMYSEPESKSKIFLMGKGNKFSKSESKMDSRMDKGKSSQSKVSRNNNSGPKPKQSSQSKMDKLALSILSKLPVKSLKRFGCVSKSWYILFENSDFMTIYTNHFMSRIGSEDHYHTFILSSHIDPSLKPAYFYKSEFHLLNDTVQFNLPPTYQQSGCNRRILNSASVNGIFCLLQKLPIDLQYVLWNPATQEFRVIPRSPADLSPRYPQNNLSFSHAFNGFGYDQLRDDFKVIQFITFDYLFPTHVPPVEESYFEIYSLKSNSWRTIDMKDAPDHWGYCRSKDTREVYVDGACHWLLVTQENHFTEKSLLSFDLSDEVFLITPIGRQPFFTYASQEHLALLNGSIALISNCHDDIIFHIYILGELGVGESWIKLYIYGPFSSIKWPPVGFGKTGYIFFSKKDYELAYVDLSTQRIEEVGITGAKSSVFQVGLYKESLLSIGGSSK